MKHLCLSALLGLFLLAGCSKQNEGATCYLSNGNDDCDNGLICIAPDKLASEVSSDFGAARCCPKDGNSSSSKCKLATESDVTAGGAGGEAGASSEGGAAASGGTSASGGTAASGGTTSEGGTASSGGVTSTGGTTSQI